MRMKMLPCDDVDKIIALIKNECDVTRGDDFTELIVTGNGTNRHKQRLEDELRVRLKIANEFEMAVDGTFLMFRMSEEPFLPLQEEPQKRAVEKFKILRNWVTISSEGTRQKWQLMQDMEETLSWKPEATKQFPFLLVTCGSGFGFDKINEDGTYERVDIGLFGGRSVLGLLAQLTKEKDFDELLSMAMTSDGKTVDMYTSDVVNQDTGDKVYSSLSNNDLLIFPFGKAYSRDDVKPGDMVHSVLNIISINVCQLAHLVAITNNCPLVVFNGNLVTSPFIQDKITFEMKFRNLGSPVDKRVKFGFLKNGGFLTAIGASAAGANFKVLPEKAT